MSDGPHKSLPMRRAWKRVAERGDKVSFAPDEVCGAMLLALEVDARGEVSSSFLSGLLQCLQSREESLFPDNPADDLSHLAESAGTGFGRSVADFAAYFAHRGDKGSAVAEKAVTYALVDRAGKCIKQVEEHYLRESSSRRAMRVRSRLEAAIGIGASEMKGLARRLLGLEMGDRPVLKKAGLDDGVLLR
jgi:hypothetical protein